MQQLSHTPQVFTQTDIDRSTLRLGSAIVGLLLAAGCQSQSLGDAITVPPKNIAHDDLQAELTLVARISKEIGDATCTYNTECRTLPLGDRACGGPVSWLPLSTVVSDIDELNLLAAKLASLQRLNNARSGMQSTCQYQPDPGAVCLAQRCVLQEKGISN